MIFHPSPRPVTAPAICDTVIAGIAGAVALSRFVSSELWEVKAADPQTFAAVTALLVGIAAIACVLPTRRAVRVDPNHALDHD